MESQVNYLQQVKEALFHVEEENEHLVIQAQLPANKMMLKILSECLKLHPQLRMKLIIE